MKKLLLILFLIFITRISLALTIIPARIEVIQKAGEEKEYYFLIKNTREEPIIIKVSVHDFDIDKNGKVLITERKTLPNWIRIPIKEVRISSSASKKIFFTIMLATGTIGEKHCLFYFEEVPEKSGSAIATVLRIGSAIYCISEGTEIIKIKIDNFKIFTDEVSLLFSNLGNIHLRPEIILKIKKGEEIIEEMVLTKGFPILPYQQMHIKKKFSNILDIDNYEAEIIATFGEIYGQKTIQIKNYPFGFLELK